MNDKSIIKNPIYLQSALPIWNMVNKTVILRADLNVSLRNNDVLLYNDLKLESALPTIKYILKQAKTLIIITHIGNPQFQEKDLSTQNLIPWFKSHNLNPYFVATPQELFSVLSNPPSPQLLLLENVRFFSGEKEQGRSFAEQLARGSDLYVNDAFGTAHRSDTSVTLLAEQFSKNDRTIGFLIEKELLQLNRVFTNIQKPFLLFIGGKKAHDKIPLIEHLLPSIDGLFLCPALVFSFIKGRGGQIGASFVDEKSFEMCQKLMQTAQKIQVPVFFPLDYLIERNNGNLIEINSDQFQQNDRGICIGPKTIKYWQTYITQAKTILYNGGQGFIEKKETLIGMKELCNAFGLSSATTVIAGGDSTAMIKDLGIQFDYLILSTGGGATLAYLGGKTLPGLQLFINK